MFLQDAGRSAMISSIGCKGPKMGEFFPPGHDMNRPGNIFTLASWRGMLP
jgi:hypothetical protein